MAVSSLYNPTVLAQNMEENSLSFPDVTAFNAVQEKYQQCLTICRPIGYKYGIVEALNALGVLHLYLESKEHALPTLSEALAICREMGDQIGEATTLANMGFVYYYTGKWEQATAHYGNSLQIYQGVGNPLEIAKLHMQFGRIDAFRKDTASLFTHFFTAHAISKYTGFENPEIQQQILFQRNQLKPKQFLYFAQKAKKHLAEELQPLIDIEEYVSNWDVQDTTVHYDTPKVGRNDPCPCGSGKKYKKCCGR
jgi:tetratricopeptide (TPR) repeat protein